MMRNKLHQSFCDQNPKIVKWHSDLAKTLGFPIYSSYDVRDAGFKVSNVDANIYPAGFNNICPTDKESAVGLMKNFLDNKYGEDFQKIMLVTEEHTKNPYYWDNVYTIKELLEKSGRQVLIVFPRALPENLKMTSANGHELIVHSGELKTNLIRDFSPQLVISNNDFSQAHEDWARDLNYPVNPPRELGWYQRKKSTYFKFYNQLVHEFCEILGIDSFLLDVQTEQFDHFDLASEESRSELATRVDSMIESLRKKYEQRGIVQDPFVFVKNNSGTYGLAVIKVKNGSEVLKWTYDSRKKMKAAKGGRDVEEVIIQEGIPSIVQAEGASAEPVIYMIGCELAGGFLRTHAAKDGTESLNSPGAVYKRLCVSDLNVSLKGSPLENVYGWTARLGHLAIGLEAKDMGVEFKGFRKSACS